MVECPIGKVRYDRLGALMALAKLGRRDDPRHRECRIYSCDRCGGWHLTSWRKRCKDG